MLLVAIAEHGLMPTNVAARMTLAADPGSLQGAVAAGILGAGRCSSGTAEECALLLERGARRDRRRAGRERVSRARLAAKVPGFGHPVHRPVDPRAERILELADERGVSGATSRSRGGFATPCRGLGQAAADERRDADRGSVARPRLRVGGREGGADPRAHGGPAGAPRRGAGAPDRLPAGARRRSGGERTSDARPRASRAVPGTSSSRSTTRASPSSSRTCSSARRSTARSWPRPESLRGDGGGLADIAQLPLTEKDELRATARTTTRSARTSASSRAELARIYSTSGTTGAPSYIPLTASDLENWVTGSARSYAASGIGPGERDRHDVQRRPVRRRRRARRLSTASASRTFRSAPATASGCCARSSAAARAAVADAVVRRLPARARRPARARASSASSSPASRAAASRPSARSSRRAGARSVTEAMGIGDIGASLWGECEQQDGMHLGARGFVHAELIDPETGGAARAGGRREGELVLTHLRHRAAPLLRFRTRDHVVVWTSPCACGRTAPRVRCLGRTDDMLIVRGVNVFPSAVREVVGEFAPAVSGHVLVEPRAPGVKQEPPLPVSVELARGCGRRRCARRGDPRTAPREY